MANDRKSSRKEDYFLSTKEAADFLKSTPKSIYALVHDKSIPHYKRAGGSRLLFKKSELIEWVEKDRVAME